MPSRLLPACLCVAAIGPAVWLSRNGATADPPAGWIAVVPGVLRTEAAPYGYALVSGGKALLIDAATPPDAAKPLAADGVAAVLLTHHHRDTAKFAAEYRAAGVPVRAGKASAEWLSPENVTKFWKDSIPLRDSRTAYFVLPEGVPGVEYTLDDGKPFVFGEWSVTPVATPGHSRDHLAFLVRPVSDVKGPELAFCGDALHSPGKLWTPFTTDWDHWTDAGLKETAMSLRKLAGLNPTHLLPAHGPAVTKDPAKVLTDTAAAVDEAAFLKSFERFTNRLGNPPQYPFLVDNDQVGSGGDRPWSRVSDHLWITGNTYVLKATDSPAVLVLDPWGERSVKQIAELLADDQLGPVEVVVFSHAHYDHFDGVYTLPGRDRTRVWGLNLVADPLKEPLRIRAPFLDPRPVRFTEEFADGDAATWGGYTFTFHHFPGQTWFTSAIETTVDGKRGLFTADNFFHQRQFSGSGGWMGLNRSSPTMYAASARKVLDLAPEWVLAEHGGPFVFDAEDFRRRMRWGEAAAKACDALCVTGNHRRDWNPHEVTVEPVFQVVKPGRTLRLTGPAGFTRRSGDRTVVIRGRGVFPDRRTTFRGTGAFAWDWSASGIELPATLPPGRYVFAVEVSDDYGVDTCDTAFAVDVVSP